MLVLSFDLGIINQAWAITENGKLLNCGRIKYPISDLTDKTFNSQKLKFVSEIRELMKKIGPDSLVLAERFQSRMFNPGAQIELVSVMLGLIASQAPGVFYPVTAATWKNHFLKVYGENVMEVILQDAFDEHVCDAIGIGLWYFEKESNKKAPHLKKYFPIPETCKRCWWKTHGCRGEKQICKDFVEVNKQVKCIKCSGFEKCKAETKEEYGLAKAKKINRATSGCVQWSAQ